MSKSVVTRLELLVRNSTITLRRDVQIRLLEAELDKCMREENPRRKGYPIARQLEKELRELLAEIERHDWLLSRHNFMDSDEGEIRDLKLKIEKMARYICVDERKLSKADGRHNITLREKIRLAREYAKIHKQEPFQKPKAILQKIRPYSHSNTTENYRDVLLVGIDAIIRLGEATHSTYEARKHIPGGD